MAQADDETFALMRESKCLGVILGIESGDPAILSAMRKSATVERYEYGLRKLREHGIVTHVSLMCGFPGETAQSVQNTIDFLDRTQPDFFSVQVYNYDSSTPIATKAADYRISGGGYNWVHATMDWQEAARLTLHVFKTVENSIPIGLYGLSLWGFT